MQVLTGKELDDYASGASIRAMNHAIVEAKAMDHLLGGEHLLLGLLLEGTSVTYQVLTQRGITADSIREIIKAEPSIIRRQPDGPTTTKSLARVFRSAIEHANKFDHVRVCPSDLLAGIMATLGDRGYSILKLVARDFDKLAEEIQDALKKKEAAKTSEP